MATYNKEELDYIATQVLPSVLEQIRANAAVVDDVELVTETDGITTLPAYDERGGVKKVVRVPLSTFYKPAEEAAAELTEIITSALESMQESVSLAVTNAEEATDAAETATEAANTATSNANTATEEANTATTNANTATEAANTATEAAQQATTQVLDTLARLIPSAMEVDAPERITFGNIIPQQIEVTFAPDNTLKNVIYLSDNRAVEVWPDGSVRVVAKGRSTVHIIPTNNTALAKTVAIEVVDPDLRMYTKTEMRFTASGQIRLT